MRNRKTNNVKNIKDYLVPIITFGLIFILIYVAFSGSDGKNANSESITNNSISQNINGLAINFNENDSKIILIDEADKKIKLLSGDMMIPGHTVMVEKGSLKFEIPNEASFALDKNGELKYGKNSKMKLNSSELWVVSENDIEIDMKFASVKIGKNSVLNLKQNEVSSTVYLLKGTVEVKSLAGVSTFLAQGKQLKISNKDASKDDIDLVALKEDFDDYFKISDWYLKNNGSIALTNTIKTDTEGSGGTLLGSLENENIENTGSLETRKPLTISNLVSFDKIYDEGTVPTDLTNISGKYTDDRIMAIEVQGKRVKLNNETKTFSILNIDTSKKSNDLIIKIFDGGNNIIAKYLYTLYYSSGKDQTASNGFATINTTAYPVNGTDFVISVPTVKSGETFSSENTFYGTVKNPNVASVYINGYKLKTFNGKTFRYHAYKRFKTLGEGVNNYEVKYLGKDGKVILKKYVSINKKTKAVVPPKTKVISEETTAQ